MALNSLELFFGPRLPQEFQTVGLAFIAAPNLRPDTAIGVLSAIRYAKQNYDHVEPQVSIFSSGIPNKKLHVNFTADVIRGFTSTTSQGLIQAEGDVELIDKYWGPQVLNSTIKVLGMTITPADTWCPVISPGLVWRDSYILASSGLETSGNSWLRRAIPEDGLDHNLILIYSVPETLYTSLEASAYGQSFPPSDAYFKTVKEFATVVGPHQIGYEGNIDVLQSVTINGSSVHSGNYTGTETSSSLAGINKIIKRINTKIGLVPDMRVELSYKSFNDYYVYSGFRDSSGNWWPFDANPEYGHIIGDSQASIYRLSSDALLRQVTLYAIPTAAIEVSFQSLPDIVSYIGVLKLRAIRGIDNGETHFIRHIISSEPVEIINSRSGGTVLNSWGYAIFGRNFYDEQNIADGDVFSLTIPSMIPLGRFVLGAPASVNSVKVADIRQRGGGVPTDFPMVAVESTVDGIDRLRSFYDMSIWDGAAYKEGGVVEVQIDSSLLKTDADSTDSSTFLASEIDEIVRNNIPPGIDYTIKYVDNL